MIKPTALNRLKPAFWLALIFLLSSILQVNWVIPLFLACLFIYLKTTAKNYNLLNLILLFVLVFTVSYIIAKRGLPEFYIPFASAPMLATLLFNDLGLSLLLSLGLSVTVANLFQNNFFSAVFLISGLLSSILVYGARRRSVIIRTGLIIGLAQTISLLFVEGFSIANPLDYSMFFVNGLFCGIIVIGTLPIFEYLFKTVTNISLLELADFNQPLLQRMVMEAAGTYHHSLIVGNLSEAACSAIGANALLARIGAYYHDIGKLEKPGYFSENQDKEMSKHDALSPAMSKMVIMNHVHEGLELARRHKLNPRIIDFIRQHHGTSLVYYFYRRALEGLEDDEVIKEEGFRYPGPKPNTKETAIVLLADSVEAATRALKEPTPANITDVVHKVINNKFIDGQLDECDLTLKDLEKISEIFIRILSGIYHGRITYP